MKRIRRKKYYRLGVAELTKTDAQSPAPAEKKTNYWLWGIGAVAVLGIGYLVYTKFKKPKQGSTTPTGTQTPTGSGGGSGSNVPTTGGGTTPTQCGYSALPDKIYTGTATQKAQTWLNDNGYTDANGNKLVVDGIWGQLTDTSYNKLFKKCPALESSKPVLTSYADSEIAKVWNFFKTKLGAKD